MTAYDSWFYKSMLDGSLASAREVLPEVFAVAKPKSVLDLGCGEGIWLRVAKELGATTLVGFDGAYVQLDHLQIDKSEFHSVDLAKAFPAPVRVDLAISLEVAEQYLPESLADEIVAFLTSCSDTVFFGAAIPRQGGTDHVNEQWQSYWAKKFQRHGFEASTDIRDTLSVAAPDLAAMWYRQNALLYRKRAQSIAAAGPSDERRVQLLDVVHPDLYSMKMRRYAPVREHCSRYSAEGRQQVSGGFCVETRSPQPARR